MKPADIRAKREADLKAVFAKQFAARVKLALIRQHLRKCKKPTSS